MKIIVTVGIQIYAICFREVLHAQQYISREEGIGNLNI